MRSLILATPSSPRSVDDVGGAELPGELLPRLVTAHRDDPLRAELLRGQHTEQADRAVANHRNRLPRSGLSGDGPEPAGAQHIGERQKVRDQVVGRDVGRRDQGAVGQRNPHPLRLRALRSRSYPVDAGALVAGPADFAGVVGGEERADHELAGPDRGDLGPDLLDDAHILVAHRRGSVDLVESPVGPQVRPADTRRGQADDRVGRLQDRGSGRSSTRTSPGAYMTAPRTNVSLFGV